jgi:hypothetical protein
MLFINIETNNPNMPIISLCSLTSIARVLSSSVRALIRALLMDIISPATTSLASKVSTFRFIEPVGIYAALLTTFRAYFRCC